MRHQHLELAKVCAKAYEAAAEPELWPHVLADLSRLFDSAGAYTALLHSPTDQVLHSLTYHLPTDAVEEYSAYVIRIDPGPQRTTRDPVRPSFFDQLHTFEQEMSCDARCAWLPQGNGFGYHLRYRGFEDHDLVRIVCLQRIASQTSATEEQIRMFSQLASHLHRALRLTTRFEQLSLRQRAIAHAADAFSCGVFLLDPTARVLYQNAAAECMTAAQDGLTLGAESLRFSSPAARHEFTACFAATACGSINQVVKVPEIILAERPSGKRAYLIRMTLLPRQACASSASERVLVFVTDPESGPKVPVGPLMRAYGLTRREADLALQLAEGLSLNEAAGRLGVQRETARSYLKSIFTKTNVSHQGELVKLVWSIAIGASGVAEKLPEHNRLQPSDPGRPQESAFDMQFCINGLQSKR